MVRFLVFIVLILFLYTDCTPTKSSNERRRELIEKAVTAFQHYDTNQLFTIVDTGRCFDLYGKEGFLHKVNFVFNRLKTCSQAMPDSIREEPVNSLPFKDYVVPFCRDSSGAIIRGSFDLVFSFADYANDRKIMCIDVNRHRAVGDSATIAPPKLPGN